jgi:hypothetical protein
VDFPWNPVNRRVKAWEGQAGMVKRREDGQIGMFQSPRHHPAPLPERITKNVPGRAVDVNRPVTCLVRSCCVPGRAGTRRYRGINIPRTPCHGGAAPKYEIRRP